METERVGTENGKPIDEELAGYKNWLWAVGMIRDGKLRGYSIEALGPEGTFVTIENAAEVEAVIRGIIKGMYPDLVETDTST